MKGELHCEKISVDQGFVLWIDEFSEFEFLEVW